MRGVLLAVLVGVVGCGKKPEIDSSDAATIVDITASRLFKDYQGNVAAADAKYAGRELRVTGRVLEVEKWGDGYGVGIETGPNIMPNGQQLRAAVVAAVSREDAAMLKDFDAVSVVGHFAKQDNDPDRMGGLLLKLDRARVVSHTPQAGPKGK